MKEFLHYALRPLRHFADFSGRSRRTELIAWWIASSLALLALHLILTIPPQAPDRDGARQIEIAAEWFLMVPTLSLLVRRLHDTGRSGWWVGLGIPAVADNLYEDWQRVTSPGAFVPSPDLPVAVAIPLAAALIAALIALLVMILWNDDPEANRWGPNPRHDAPLAA